MASTTLHLAGVAGLFLTGGMIVSGFVGLGYDDPDAVELFISAALVGAISLPLWRLTRPDENLSRLHAFTAVGSAWIFAFAMAIIPYLLAGTFPTVVQALFETVSGLTTTGSTVLADIESNGKGLLFYRQYTQWFGGGGIVLLAIAILQGFGVGGLELAGAEIAGPSAERIAPRVATTARRLWTVYVALTGVVAAALIVVGASLYDAITHAMATIPTAGFSTYNDSISHFDSGTVEWILTFGMFLGGINFALQYQAYTRGPKRFLESPEFRTFMAIFGGGVAAVTAINVFDGGAFFESLRNSAFNVATTLTTCGFGTSDFTQWKPSAQLLLVGFMMIGGMTGSTSGGIKILRVRIAMAHLVRDIRQAREPRGVFLVRLGKDAVANDTVAKIGAFVTLYVVTILIGTVLMTLLGEDLITGFSGVVSDIGLVGPGLGDAGPHSNFLVYSDPAKVVLIVMMFLGRMELYVALLMFVAPTNAVRNRFRDRRDRRERNRATSTLEHVRR